jgi:hypothetical protein
MEMLSLYRITDTISDECTCQRAPVIPISKDGERNEAHAYAYKMYAKITVKHLNILREASLYKELFGI